MPQQIVVSVQPDFVAEDGTHFDAVVSALEHFGIPSQVNQAGDGSEYVVVPRKQLAMVMDMANSHVDDIISGIDDGTYDAKENLDIGDKSSAVDVVESILRPMPDTMKQCETEAGRTVLRVTEPDAPGLHADITNGDGNMPDSPETDNMLISIYSSDSPTRVSLTEVQGRKGLNDAYERLVGYRPDDAAGRPLLILKLIGVVAGAIIFLSGEQQSGK